MKNINCCRIVRLVVLSGTIGMFMKVVEAEDGREVREQWTGWRSGRQTGGRGGSSLNAILGQTGLHDRSRQKLLQGLSSRDQDQLAADLTELIRALNQPSYSALRDQVRRTIAQPMSREVALDMLSRLNMQFRELPWWKRINMLSVNKLW